MVKESLRLYGNRLGDKNVLTKQDLAAIIKIDNEKICFALIELMTRNVADILQEFFGEDSEVVPLISASSKDAELCHVGFEIYEPLDLVLQGFSQTFDKLNRNSGSRFAVRKILRFPASQAFQNRVNAFTEILRIWVEMDGRQFMLELFDIHRPVDIFSLERKHRFCQSIADIPSVLSQEYVPCSDTRREIFSRDKIWHYAVNMQSPEKVLELHEYFKTFVIGRDTYQLPFEDIVHNKGDGSYYSKIINKEQGTELEFVTSIQQKTEDPLPRNQGRGKNVGLGIHSP